MMHGRKNIKPYMGITHFASWLTWLYVRR